MFTTIISLFFWKLIYEKYYFKVYLLTWGCNSQLGLINISINILSQSVKSNIVYFKLAYLS